jgi:hypothetical protein
VGNRKNQRCQYGKSRRNGKLIREKAVPWMFFTTLAAKNGLCACSLATVVKGQCRQHGLQVARGNVTPNLRGRKRAACGEAAAVVKRLCVRPKIQEAA